MLFVKETLYCVNGAKQENILRKLRSQNNNNNKKKGSMLILFTLHFYTPRTRNLEHTNIIFNIFYGALSRNEILGVPTCAGSNKTQQPLYYISPVRKNII